MTPNTNIGIAGVVGGAASVIVLWVLSTFVIPATEIPVEVAGAFSTLCIVVAGLFIKPTPVTTTRRRS